MMRNCAQYSVMQKDQAVVLYAVLLFVVQSPIYNRQFNQIYFYLVNIFIKRNIKILKGKTESLTVTISE